MRYFLRREQRSELVLRQEYLYDVFKLWFINTGEIGSFDILEAFPFGNDDLLLIYGHNGEIVSLFNEHATELKEQNIAICHNMDGPKDIILRQVNQTWTNI